MTLSKRSHSKSTSLFKYASNDKTANMKSCYRVRNDFLD